MSEYIVQAKPMMMAKGYSLVGFEDQTTTNDIMEAFVAAKTLEKSGNYQHIRIVKTVEVEVKEL